MKTMMKTVALALGLITMSTAALATEYGFTGKVKHIHVHAEQNTSWTDVDWVAIEGATSAGSCYVQPGLGLLQIRLEKSTAGERMFSMLLSAQLADRTVSVYVDDSVTPNTACDLLHMNIN